ncbi:MAG: response regulator [Coriobacteriia bacterium]|nr:response regulator [Coriobacteriia bacterium]MCL2749487.1 response regulator [Coriobacteriia bacterium]
MTPTVANTSIDTSDPRIKQRVRQKLLDINARRMLVLCLLFVVLQAATLLLGSANIAFFYPDSGHRIFYLGSNEFVFLLNVGTLSLLRIVSLCLGALFALLFALGIRGLIKSPKTQNNLVHACIIILSGIQIIVFSLEFDSLNLLFNLVVFLLMLGILPVLPRLHILGFALAFALLSGVSFIVGLPSYGEYISSVGVYTSLAIVALLASLCASWLNYSSVEKTIAIGLELEDQKANNEAYIEEQTAEYREKARAAEAANLAKTRFLTRVSHEMRTSLTTILGMVFVVKETNDPKSREESLLAIDQASHKLRDIVANIIDTTKIELDFAGDDLNQEFALLNADKALPQRMGERVEAPNLAGKNILIVEDLETNRFVLREYLKVTKANVEEAENGRIAVEMFSASPVGYYNFVFMDLLMPEMNGHDATRAIRSLKRGDALDVPIVAVSANAFKEDIEASLAAGMDMHLAKPVEQSTIFSVLIERII